MSWTSSRGCESEICRRHCRRPSLPFDIALALHNPSRKRERSPAASCSTVSSATRHEVFFLWSTVMGGDDLLFFIGGSGRHMAVLITVCFGGAGTRLAPNERGVVFSFNR